MKKFAYFQPTSLEELLNLLNDEDGCILAGGTDILPKIRKGFNFGERVIDISRIRDFNFINVKDDQVTIGSMTTYNQIRKSKELSSAASIMATASSSIGAYQTRQRATIGGGIGNASPASDIILPLLALDASVSLLHKTGKREVPLKDFLLGPGRTDRKQGEVISGISFTKLAEETKYFFYKHGNRNAMTCAVVNAVLISVITNGIIKVIRIAIGSVAPKAIRCFKTEEYLKESNLNAKTIQEAAELAVSESNPITDVRAKADFRKYLVKKMVARGLQSFMEEKQV